ncbi:hypothetical protein [Acetatifactor aquisgranensis]|nr:hypothetical protein [Acetatifactor aquisgranensis]
MGSVHGGDHPDGNRSHWEQAPAEVASHRSLHGDRDFPPGGMPIQVSA